MPLTRAELLALDDCKPVAVTVRGWGEVLLKPMSGAERDEFDAEAVKRKSDLRGFRVQLAIASLANPDGSRMFSADDAEALNGKSGAALAALCEEAAKLNGMQSADEVEGN